MKIALMTLAIAFAVVVLHIPLAMVKPMLFIVIAIGAMKYSRYVLSFAASLLRSR